MRAAIGVTLLGVGSLLVYAGFKDKSVWSEILGVIRG